MDKIILEAQSIVADAIRITQLTHGSASDMQELESLVTELRTIREDAIGGNEVAIQQAVNTGQNAHVAIGALYLIIAFIFVLAALSRVCDLLVETYIP